MALDYLQFPFKGLTMNLFTLIEVLKMEITLTLIALAVIYYLGRKLVDYLIRNK